MDIVVKGRNVEVPEHYRQHVADKLHKVERYDQKLIRVDIELFHERNPRQSDNCQRVEITCYTRGPVIRAEACAENFYTALDMAITKLDTRLRRAADRRRVHRGRRAPISVAAATAPLAAAVFEQPGNALNGSGHDSAVHASANGHGGPMSAYENDEDQPWHVVRMKEHSAVPMTVEDALFEMELVGHDFYLFNDKETGRPSVVYRRRAYDYGIIALAE